MPDHSHNIKEETVPRGAASVLAAEAGRGGLVGETAVQTKPDPQVRPSSQEAVVVARGVEERPLVQKMPLDALMQPFLDTAPPAFWGQELVSSVLPEAGGEEEAATEPEADEEGVIEELAQHVYRQLRQRLATDWERRRMQ